MNTSSFRTFPGALALTVGLLLAGTASAYLPSSTLAGRAAAGDSVSVRNIATEHHLEHVVRENGRFLFPKLPIGIYEVVIRHPDGSSDAPILARARLGETTRVN